MFSSPVRRHLLTALLPALTVGALFAADQLGGPMWLPLVACVLLPVGLGFVREAHDAERFATEVRRLSATFFLSSIATGLVAWAVMWATLSCECPPEVFTPGRGWHYNECFCGIEYLLVPMGWVASILAAFAMNVVAWTLLLARWTSGHLKNPDVRNAWFAELRPRRLLTGSLPLAVLLFEVFTVAWHWESAGCSAYGFPLPYLEWAGHSLEWRVALPALLFDFGCYLVAAAGLIALARRCAVGRLFVLLRIAIVAVALLGYAVLAINTFRVGVGLIEVIPSVRASDVTAVEPWVGTPEYCPNRFEGKS